MFRLILELHKVQKDIKIYFILLYAFKQDSFYYGSKKLQK